MSDLDRVRDQVSAIVADIERNLLRTQATDLADCEAYEIIRRIERRLAGIPVAEIGDLNEHA